MPTLYIIGNGFDLHHELRTSYCHFFDYVESIGDKTFLTQLDTYFGKTVRLNGKCGNLLWSQLEKALGIYNVQNIMESMFEGHTFDIDHASSSVGEVEAEVECMFVPIREKFTELFANWVRRIDLTNTARLRIPHLDQDGNFLTFNYTNTLECVYGIPKSQIRHIHGDASNKDDELIVGHNNKFTDFKDYPDDFYDRNDYQRKIAGVINGLYKDTHSIIMKNKDFFDSLYDVDKVVVYGHSLEEIDKPYFDEVQRRVKPDATWWMSKYEIDEQADKRNFCKSIGVSDKNIHTFMW